MSEIENTTAAPVSFELVSHETRAAILQELAAQQRTKPRDPFLSFSALRERVGHHDPGNFNYHLGQLVSRFVVKNADGYRLSHEGQMIVGAMVAHQYNQSNDASLPSVTTRCQTCGETATVHYEEGLFTVLNWGTAAG